MKTILPALMTVLLLSCASSAFAAKETFERTKPHVNVGTIGHTVKGTALVTTALAAASGNPLETAKLGDAEALVATVETDQAHYAIIDFEARDLPIPMAIGTFSQGAALMVASAADGPMPQTKEHILLARQVGVPAVVVFLDWDGVRTKEQVDEAEASLRRTLTASGYDGHRTMIIRGSAEGALRGDRDGLLALAELMDALDKATSR